MAKYLLIAVLVFAMLFAVATPALAGKGGKGNATPKPEKTEVSDPAETTNPGQGNGHTDNGKNDADPNGGGKNTDGSKDGNNGCGQEKKEGQGATDDNNGKGCKPKTTATPGPTNTPAPTATPTATPTTTPEPTKTYEHVPGEIITTTVPFDGPVPGPVVTTTVPSTLPTCPFTVTLRDTRNVYIYVVETPEPKRNIVASAGTSDADTGMYLPVSGGDADCPAIPWAQFGMVLLGAVLLSFVAGRKSKRAGKFQLARYPGMPDYVEGYALHGDGNVMPVYKYHCYNCGAGDHDTKDC